MGGRGGGSSGGGAAMYGMDPNMPSFRTFDSLWAANDYHMAFNFDWSKWNAMTREERQGVVDYTDYFYGAINTQARTGVVQSARTTEQIKYAEQALSHWVAYEDVVTFRGACNHWTANLLGCTEAQLSNGKYLKSRIGKIVTDKGFMSSGIHHDKAWSADVQYKIYVRKGTSGMYVDPISANRGEYEFLFNSNTQFKVHGIRTNEFGHIKELILEALPRKK